MSLTTTRAAGGYVAFISYSHGDQAVARWLHRRLENYRLPRRLAGTGADGGKVPERLSPIFRDRDELPAACDLSQEVRAALADSRNLIVLCSPRSAVSPWVAKEIATFRELHPDLPILAAIVAGEPGESFPPLLREGGAEPLAADLREEGDGRRLGLLKLVAGLAGVGLDALVQRDATRRVRRVTYVTVAAIVAMLIMSLLTGLALTARAEAQRQRNAAEGLIEFMHTDLRNRLRRLGSIEIMDAVNRRTLAYYEGRGYFARRARILHAMGEDLITAGRPSAAIPWLNEAYRTTRALLERRPNDPERILDHAHSEFWIGRVHEVKGDWATAERRYLSFAAGTRRLIELSPRNPDYMMEAGWAAVDLGNLQLNGRGNALAAQHSYERAIGWFSRAVREKPSDQNAPRVLANAYGWLADSFAARRLWDQALDARGRQLVLAEELYRKDPGNSDYRYRLAIAHRAMARPLANLRPKAEPERARRHLFEAYGTAVELSSQDPKNAEWLSFRAAVECDLLFAGLGYPPRVNGQTLRREVRNAAAALAARQGQGDMSLAPCLHAIETAP
jgi:tetratricopeptide (TPR) repeat protein